MKQTFTILIGLVIIYSTGFSQGNNSLNFDGVNDYISTGVPSISGNTPKTVEAWIKTTANADPNAGGAQKTILDMGSTANGSRFTLNLLWSNAIRLEVGGNGVSDVVALNNGAWHHVAAVYNPTATNTVKLYVDGVLHISSSIASSISVNTGNGNLVIGRRIDGINQFSGNIDEVRVWNVALSDAAIASNYNHEFCTSQVGLVAYFKLNQGMANATNNGNNVAYNQSGANGTLNNFLLSGTTSNWVTGAPLPGSSFSTQTINQCTPYATPSGHIISATGIYKDTFTNTMGCDSIRTYYATIGGSSSTQSLTACGQYTHNGHTYNSSTTYSDTFTNANGCDSIIITALTINPYLSSTQSITSCSYFTSPTGKIWNTSGTYKDTVVGSSGCDSIITYHVTINLNTQSSITASGCTSYTTPGGNVLTSSGIYLETIPNANGCDSLISINLTIGLPDTTVTQSAGTLTAVQTGATYQWLDCNNSLNPIPGATSKTFSPSSTGNYAVKVTLGNCSSISGCHQVIISSIQKSEFQNSFKVFPNPTASTLLNIISSKPMENLTVTVYNIIGQNQYSQTFHNQTQMDIPFEVSEGVYIIELKSESGEKANYIIQKI